MTIDPFTALSIGADVIGGIFGASSEKKQREQDIQMHHDRFVDLRADAERGGFNPLTALMADGASTANTVTAGSLATPAVLAGGAADLFQGLATANQVKEQQERANNERAKVHLETVGGNLRGSAQTVAVQSKLNTRAAAARPSAVTTFSGGRNAGPAGDLPFIGTTYGGLDPTLDSQDYALSTTSINAGPTRQVNTVIDPKTGKTRIVSSPRGEEIDEVGMNLAREYWVPAYEDHPYRTAAMTAGAAFAGLGVTIGTAKLASASVDGLYNGAKGAIAKGKSSSKKSALARSTKGHLNKMASPVVGQVLSGGVTSELTGGGMHKIPDHPLFFF